MVYLISLIIGCEEFFMHKRLFLLTGVLMLSGCGAYDSGHKDGYAAGYNTTCNIRGTLVEDSWNPVYKKGYKDGYKEGSVACMRRR